MAGVLLLVLGIAGERSGYPAFNFIFIGILLLGGGFLLWGKLRRKPRRNTRFSLFRKQDKDQDDAQEPEEDRWEDGFYD